MKNIEIDEELYQYIASNTQYIGESASAILRRLINFPVKDNGKKLINASIEDTLSEATDVTEVTEVTKVNNSITSIPSKAVDDSVFNYIDKEELAMQRGAVGRFLLILAALHRVHSHHFSVVCDIRGRDRLYFAASEAELLANGHSTNPRQIPNSSFWVISNSNTTRKKMMLTKVCTALGYNEKDIINIRDLL